MKDNKFEGVAKMVQERVDGIVSYITEDNKKERQFGVPKVEGVDKVYIYDKLTEQDKAMLIQKHGMDAYRQFERDVAKVKMARGIM